MATAISNFEEQRRANINENRLMLAQIGLLNPFKENIKLTFKTKRRQSAAVKEPGVCSRKSARIEGQPTPKRGEDADYELESESSEDEQYESGRKKRRKKTPRVVFNHVKVPKNRPNFYGAVEGVDIGIVWQTRMECCRDGIHRPPVSGIHGGLEGAYSIALSGGYDDNVDWGDSFTYTGEGGRDLKGTASKPKNLRSAPQSKDQQLTRGNLALSKSVETKNPVRVIRGYKLNSPFAPEEGYRYDGLYTVEKAWFTEGVSGFGVWKFAMKRMEDQPPPPWEFIEKLQVNRGDSDGENSPTSEECDQKQESTKERHNSECVSETSSTSEGSDQPQR